MQEPLPQESKARTTIHDSFECLQLVFFALGDALSSKADGEPRVPRRSLARSQRQSSRARVNATFDSLLHPGGQLLMFALAHHLQKGLQQAVDGLHI